MSRERHLQRYFGISEDQYKQLLKKQKGACYICEKPADYFAASLAVDHNHKTGEIRGLLCYRCNHFIVGRYTIDDLPLLKRLVKYVQRTTGWFVPEERPKQRRKRRRTKSST